MPRSSAQSLQILRDTFGHASFRPGQPEIVSALEEGLDAIAVLPTGSGKSICFQVPALIQSRPTLIVSPLISLMRDQVEGLRSRGVRAVAITSESTPDDRSLAESYLRERREALVYASPERLCSTAFRALTPRGSLSRVVVDEAHCISEWGHDFRPAYRQIADFAAATGRPPIAAFTATAAPATRSDIKRQLGLRQAREFVHSVDRPNLHWSVRHARTLAAAFEHVRLAIGSSGGATIVYVPTRAQTIAVASAARRNGHDAEAYHAGLSASRRREVQQSFMLDDGPVIVATCAFGMGIDHPHVRLVCHIGTPGALESYVQEAGRAGRDGRPAHCLLVTAPGARALHRARLSGLSGSARTGARRRMRAMDAYVTETVCRRAAVSAYFGEGVPECSGCDLCDARRAPGNRTGP